MTKRGRFRRVMRELADRVAQGLRIGSAFARKPERAERMEQAADAIDTLTPDEERARAEYGVPRDMPKGRR